MPAGATAEANGVQASAQNAPLPATGSLEDFPAPPADDRDAAAVPGNSGDVEPDAPQPPASPLAQLASSAQREPVQLPVDGVPPISEAAGDSYRQQCADEAHPATNWPEATQAAAAPGNGIAEQGTERLTAHQAPAADSVERVTEAAQPGIQHAEDGHHNVDGMLLLLASDASADTAGTDAAAVISEQPDDAQAAADAAEVWQMLNVESSHARCLQRLSSMCTSNAGTNVRCL